MNNPAHRHSIATILGAAVNLARTTSYRELSLRDVACAAECSTGTVIYHFETMEKLQNAIVGYALEHKIYKILADALAARHPVMAAVGNEVRQDALELIESYYSQN